MAFSDEGFAIAPLFSKLEIAALQHEITAYLDRVAKALNLPFADSFPEAPFDERIEKIAETDLSYANLLAAALCTDAHRAPAFANLAEDKRLKGAAADLIGAPVGDMTVRLRGNSARMSEQRQAWHSDFALLDGGECAKIKLTAWIPLVDAGPDSGGLEIASGRRAAPIPHTQMNGHFEIPEADISGPKVQVTCPQGAVLFLDRYTPHRALRNVSGKTRWSLVAWMKPAEALEFP